MGRILLNGLTGRDELWRLTSLLNHQQDESFRKQVPAELRRRNSRSATFWVGGFTLCILPGPAIWMAGKLAGGLPATSVSSLITGAVMGCAAVAPGISLLRIIAGRNLGTILRERRICVGCGYDLRATPARCPECGAFANSVRSNGSVDA